MKQDLSKFSRLEELLNKPLQWIVCSLHTNDLPLRHVFGALDGSTSGPHNFVGSTEKILHGPVSSWTITQFKPNVVSVFVIFSYSSRVGCHRLEHQFYAHNIMLGTYTCKG